jgi:hypothetical protein
VATSPAAAVALGSVLGALGVDAEVALADACGARVEKTVVAEGLVDAQLDTTKIAANVAIAGRQARMRVRSLVIGRNLLASGGRHRRSPPPDLSSAGWVISSTRSATIRPR